MDSNIKETVETEIDITGFTTSVKLNEKNDKEDYTVLNVENLEDTEEYNSDDEKINESKSKDKINLDNVTVNLSDETIQKISDKIIENYFKIFEGNIEKLCDTILLLSNKIENKDLKNL
jgi:hypothetical protein